jgi:hypothetical protein
LDHPSKIKGGSWIEKWEKKVREEFAIRTTADRHMYTNESNEKQRSKRDLVCSHTHTHTHIEWPFFSDIQKRPFGNEERRKKQMSFQPWKTCVSINPFCVCVCCWLRRPGAEKRSERKREKYIKERNI